ncbi:helix-turn-helix domain-containing protein [Staphylococcus caprae]|uniref:helix-turn-helix domain-containing protein n=1 Tax=Staphylococcus caprae TaxID=29380 RepID=UPI003B224535
MKKVKTLIDRKKFDSLLAGRNLNYQDLCNNMHVDRTYVSQLVNGHRYVSERMSRLILEELNVDFDDIFIKKEIDYVNTHKAIPELVITKGEIEKLLNNGCKEIAIGNHTVSLKVVG